MMKLLKIWPYPITGMMLSIAVMGNLLGKHFGGTVRNAFGAVAAVMLFITILKIVFIPKSVKEALSKLPIASVLATLPMGMMVLSTYLQGRYDMGASVMWYAGVIINIAIIMFFILKYLFPIKLEKVYASYFVTFVGIVALSVTSKPYGMESLGQLAFVFGLGTYILLLPLVIIRYKKSPSMPEALKPMIVIMAAPANLLVVGYLSLGLTWSEGLLFGLWVLGVITTLFGWWQIYILRKLPFYPSYAAYTFPLAIGALATTLMGGYMKSSLVGYMGYAQIAVSTVVIGYVFVRFIINFKSTLAGQ